MLIIDHPSEGLVRHRSDAGFKVLQTDTGILYYEAVDVESTTHSYAESDVPVYDRDMTPEEVVQGLEALL